MEVSWDGFCWPGQAHLHPIGECTGHKNLHLCKGGQKLHHPPESPHFLPDGEVDQEWAVGPSPPKTEAPLHRQGSGVIE